MICFPAKKDVALWKKCKKKDCAVFLYSKHLLEKLEHPEWSLTQERIERVLQAPQRQEQHDKDEVHYLRQIEEFGNRWLRVIVNPQKTLIITAFFDRGVQ